MESEDASTLRTPSEGSNTIPTRSSSFFRNRFSNASLLSVRTLPQYSVVDTLEGPASPASDDIAVPPSSPWNSATFGSTSPQSAIGPPRYSMLSTAAHLPKVEGEFRYSYPIRPKKPWATLHLHTRDAVPGNIKPFQSQPRVPRLWSCDPIMGTLELDLDSPQNIQQISILVKGNFVMSSLSEGSIRFLGREFTVWDKSMGDPLQPDDPAAITTQKNKTDGRFAPGTYTFPFSFPFPAHLDPITIKSSIPSLPPSTVGFAPGTAPPSILVHNHIPEKLEKKNKASWTSRFASSSASPLSADETASPHSKTQPGSPTLALGPCQRPASLPPSFMEKGINHNVTYEISARIVHGRFKANSKIKIDLVYLPALQPHAGSQKRREAYESGALLPCPMDDPEGWLACSIPTIYGVITSGERRRHTKAECTLFLAQPLSYTRGSVIPCFLTISSSDEDVVNLLSDSKVPTLKLLRRIRHPGMGQSDVMPPDPCTGAFNITWSHLSTFQAGGVTVLTHEVGRAQWWTPAKHIVQGPDVKHLEGEIHLSPTLQPSCDFEFFQIEYAVELMPFWMDKFEPEIHPATPGNLPQRDNVLTTNTVEITTLYRQNEPIPTAYSEPPKVNIRRRVNPEGQRPAIPEEDE